MSFGGPINRVSSKKLGFVSVGNKFRVTDTKLLLVSIFYLICLTFKSHAFLLTPTCIHSCGVESAVVSHQRSLLYTYLFRRGSKPLRMCCHLEYYICVKHHEKIVVL